MTRKREQCNGRIYIPGGFGNHTRQCSRNGINFEDGKWWCKQHTPSEETRRTEERYSRITEKIDAACEQARLRQLQSATLYMPLTAWDNAEFRDAITEVVQRFYPKEGE